jgi:hypothetical protein
MESKQIVIEFLKTWSAHIIAFVALIQPWIIGIWKYFFRQGHIDIYETGAIEIGYSMFGATIGLHGTLRAVHRDKFVRRITLTVIKHKDKSEHNFEWGVFRKGPYFLDLRRAIFELPSGFMLLTSQPYRYDILFQDMALQQEIRPHLEKVSQAWILAQLTSTTYDQFSKGTVHVNAYTALDRLIYWDAGSYTLKMSVWTTRPEQDFSKEWSYELTEKDVKSIRLNVVRMLRDTCLPPRIMIPYNFANVEYKPSAR